MLIAKAYMEIQHTIRNYKNQNIQYKCKIYYTLWIRNLETHQRTLKPREKPNKLLKTESDDG